MIEQGTADWKARRAGKATASRIADIMRKTKTGVAASRKNYEAQLICERLTGVVAEGFSSADMQWGVEKEPEAVAAYEFMYNATTTKIDFVDHPVIAMSGASPDRLIGDDGLLEAKCPKTATHIETLLSGEIDPDYETQIQWQLSCTNRKWCDFISFDPRLPPHLQLFVKRVERDQRRIIELETEVSAFLRGVDAKVAALQAKGGEHAIAA